MTVLNLEGYGSLTTYLSTELNSLADGGNKLGAAIDNSSGLELFADFELALASFTPGGNGYVRLYKIISVDGTNYADGSDSNDPPAGTPVWTHSILSGASAKRIVIPDVPLSPGSQKFLLENMSGAALASSGNTLKYRFHGLQSV